MPYFHQSDNETKDGTGDDRVNGNVMCQLTSLAMVLASKGIRAKDPSAQLEDELYKMAKEVDYGYKKKKHIWDNVPEMYNEILEKNFYSSNLESNTLNTDKKLTNIISQIDSGNPVIVDILFYYGGHVIVCIGYTNDALIFHDPYGNLNSGQNNKYGTDRNGAFVEYQKDKYSIGKRWIKEITKRK